MTAALLAILGLSAIIGIPAGLAIASLHAGHRQQERDDQSRPSAEIIPLSEYRAAQRDAA